MDAQNYHIANIDTKIYDNVIKMKAIGFHKATKVVLYSSLLVHYHIHVDLDLDIDKVTVQRISCSHREK